MKNESKKNNIILRFYTILGVLILSLGYYILNKYRNVELSLEIIGIILMVLAPIIMLIGGHKYIDTSKKIRMVKYNIQMSPILLIGSILMSSFLIYIGIKYNYIPFAYMGIGIIIVFVPFSLWAMKTSRKELSKLKKSGLNKDYEK